MPNPKGSFWKVKCVDCGNEQVTFSKPAMKVACIVCGSSLVEPVGGLGKFKAEIIGPAE